MKITRASVGQFGKIKQRELELHEGLNVIYGENESGKSTLLAFIKAMLYGFSSNKKSIRDNLRKRYMTWGEDKAEGEVYLDDGQVTYRIKRQFGNKKSQDKLEILNALSGESIALEPLTTPGKLLFGVEVHTYEKTSLITQLASEISPNNNDEIIKYLTNLQGTGDESTSYHKAKKDLEDYRKHITNSSKKPGVLDNLKKEYDFELEKINRLKNQKKDFDENVLSESVDLDNTLERLVATEESHNEHMDNIKSKVMRYKDVATDLKKKEIENKESLESFKNQHESESMIDDVSAQEDLNKIIEENVRKENYQENIEIHQSIQDEVMRLRRDERCNSLIEEVEKLECTIQETNVLLRKQQKLKDQLKSTYKESELRKMSNNKTWMLVAAFLSMILMIATILVEKIPTPVGTMMIVPIIFCIYRIGRINKRLKEKETIKKKILTEINRIENDAEKYCERHGAKNLNQLHEKIEKNKIEYGNINTVIKEKEKLLCEYDQKRYHDLIERSEVLISGLLKKYDCENQEALKQKIINYQKKKEKYSRIDEALRLSGKEEDTLTKKKQNLYQDILEEIHMLYEQIIAASQVKLDELKGRINKYEKEVASVDTAIKAIDDAFVQFHMAFSKNLNEEAKKILKKITSKNYNQVLVSKDFEIKISNDDVKEIKSIDYFSNGTWDQVYFSVRMAIAKIISEKINVKLPLLLDDAFVQYDEKRMEAVLEYIYDYSKNHQVILFTCQKREVEYLKKYKDVHVINMN